MKALLLKIKINSPILYYCGLAHLLLLVLMIGIAQFDHRQILGISLWVKPIKFAISIALYCLTWPLLLQYFPFQKLKRRFANFTVFAMVFEMVAIGGQAARGELSHYNVSTAGNALIFSLMGVAIVSQTVFSLWIGIRFFQVKAVDLTPALLWSIRLGIIIAGVLAMEGGIMASRLSHSVGGADGGPGLPLFNWSRLIGDLRIAHFFGLHALQIIPLFVVLTWLKTAKPVIVFAACYFLVITFLFVNAMMGRPLF